MRELPPGPRVSSPAALELATNLANGVRMMESAVAGGDDPTHDELVEAMAAMPDGVLEAVREFSGIIARRYDELGELAGDELRRRGRVRDA